MTTEIPVSTYGHGLPNNHAAVVLVINGAARAFSVTLEALTNVNPLDAVTGALDTAYSAAQDALELRDALCEGWVKPSPGTDGDQPDPYDTFLKTVRAYAGDVGVNIETIRQLMNVDNADRIADGAPETTAADVQGWLHRALETQVVVYADDDQEDDYPFGRIRPYTDGEWARDGYTRFVNYVAHNSSPTDGVGLTVAAIADALEASGVWCPDRRVAYVWCDRAITAGYAEYLDDRRHIRTTTHGYRNRITTAEPGTTAEATS